MLVVVAFRGPQPDAWRSDAGALLVRTLERDLYQGLVVEPHRLVADYERACDDGYRMACDWLEVRGTGRPRLDQATSFFGPLCDREREPVACLAVGWSRSQPKPGGRPERSSPDPKAARSGLEASCEVGLARGCVELARLLEIGVGGAPDRDRAIALAEQACGGGEPFGCAVHGELLAASGRAAEGRAVLEQACAAEPRACATLGGLDLRALSGGRPSPETVSVLQRACDGGSSRGCLSLAMALQAGEESDRFVRTYRAWSLACQAGEAEGCTWQAWSLELGRGVMRDPDRARDLYERACRMGAKQACGRVSGLDH